LLATIVLSVLRIPSIAAFTALVKRCRALFVNLALFYDYLPPDVRQSFGLVRVTSICQKYCNNSSVKIATYACACVSCV